MNADAMRARSASSALAGLAQRSVIECRGEATRSLEDAVAEEAPVELRYNGESFAVMLATPADLEDFAIGFSLSEACVGQVDDILRIDVRMHLEGVVVDIDAPATAVASADDARRLPGRSGCGLCGSRRLEDVLRPIPPVAAGPLLAPGALERAQAALARAQPLNARSGAVHAAAWASPTGEILCVREDVGRHNALDKLLGALARGRIDPRQGFVLTTSRASYEMVSKAGRLGIGLLAAMSAPTALAVDLARAGNLTLVGFVRPGRHVIYSHPERLLDADPDRGRA